MVNKPPELVIYSGKNGNTTVERMISITVDCCYNTVTVVRTPCAGSDEDPDKPVTESYAAEDWDSLEIR